MSELYIMVTGRIHGEEFFWNVAMPPLPVTDEPQDDDLQRAIDEAQETEEYMDYLADIEFFRRGC